MARLSSRGISFSGAAVSVLTRDVVAGLLVGVHANHSDAEQGIVGCPVAAAGESLPGDFARGRGAGLPGERCRSKGQPYRRVLQQSEQIQVSDVFDDDLRCHVRDVFIYAELRALHRRTEPLGRHRGSADRRRGLLVVVCSSGRTECCRCRSGRARIAISKRCNQSR
jgi:hypothetical protein